METRIFASNDLDEHIIRQLKADGAMFTNWGVGTKVITGGEQPALGGVYKLSAIRAPGGEWQPRVKVSGDAIKTSLPGNPQVRRFIGSNGRYLCDAMYDHGLGIADGARIIHPMEPDHEFITPAGTNYEDMLKPLFLKDKGFVGDDLPLLEIQKRMLEETARFEPSMFHVTPPGSDRKAHYSYKVGLEERLYELRRELIRAARGLAEVA